MTRAKQPRSKNSGPRSQGKPAKEKRLTGSRKWGFARKDDGHLVSRDVAVQTPLSVLCVHGVGDHHTDLSWQADWSGTIKQLVHQWNPNRPVVVDFLKYDDILDKYPLSAEVIAGAVWKLGTSGLIHGIGDLFGRQRGLEEFNHTLRWTAGMVAQWVDEPKLRSALRDRLTETLRRANPHVVLGHSLGSLVCYDTLSQYPAEARAPGRVFVSFGSQIGNAFVRSTFHGRIAPLQTAFWYHLYNEHDHAFTASLSVPSDSFLQIRADFDQPGDVVNHDPMLYLGHTNVRSVLWREISGAAVSRSLSTSANALRPVARRPDRRALLIGINEYPDPANRLEGCVNDVFLMSSVLQESTFAPEEIRVVLNDRATAAGILDRLHWLLDGVQAGDQRFLFYSGHGAQIPAYGVNDEIDHIDECLVPFDFDWSLDRAVTDDQFLQLYSQLPYESNFVAVLDCCHAGGMTRGGTAKVRGIDPPDDIRHRAIRWDPRLQMWKPRRLPPALPGPPDKSKAPYAGHRGAVHRLGRAVPLRRIAQPKTASGAAPVGPFMPVLFEACQEDQLSYEYRHGAASYGAFSFSLAAALRAAAAKGERFTFRELIDRASGALKDLGYDQIPCLVGPQAVIDLKIPWRTESTGAAPIRISKSN